jgi:hypothetical protein
MEINSIKSQDDNFIFPIGAIGSRFSPMKLSKVSSTFVELFFYAADFG